MEPKSNRKERKLLEKPNNKAVVVNLDCTQSRSDSQRHRQKTIERVRSKLKKKNERKSMCEPTTKTEKENEGKTTKKQQ